jgi:hypothetical protein
MYDVHVDPLLFCYERGCDDTWAIGLAPNDGSLCCLGEHKNHSPSMWCVLFLMARKY